MNPLGDLYKTQVRQLARAMGVPEEIIQKPPTADLWKRADRRGRVRFHLCGGDKLLYLLVDQRYIPEDCVQAGFAEILCAPWSSASAATISNASCL